MKVIIKATFCTLFLLAGCTPPAPPAIPAAPASPKAPSAHDDIELAALMLVFQTHAEKLHWSGEAENWALAGFYLHELEETTETIAGAGITEEGYPVSASIEGLLGAPITKMEKATEAKDKAAFTAGYDDMIRACNSCHSASKHAFIVIQRPTKPQFTNQRFEPATR